MARKKMHMGWNIAAGATMMVAAPAAGYGIAKATDIEPGWRRAALGGAATALVAGGLAIFEQTRPMALFVAGGGVLGSLALLAENWARKFWAERKARKASQPEKVETFSSKVLPQTQPSTSPIVVMKPEKERTPSMIEQLTPIFSGLISGAADIGKAYISGSKGTFGPLGSNGTFGPLGSMGVYVPAMSAAAA